MLMYSCPQYWLCYCQCGLLQDSGISEQMLYHRDIEELFTTPTFVAQAEYILDSELRWSLGCTAGDTAQIVGQSQNRIFTRRTVFRRKSIVHRRYLDIFETYRHSVYSDPVSLWKTWPTNVSPISNQQPHSTFQFSLGSVVGRRLAGRLEEHNKV